MLRYALLLHRCFEKHAENELWQGVIPYTDRIDYIASMGQDFSYVITVEKLMVAVNTIDIDEKIRRRFLDKMMKAMA